MARDYEIEGGVLVQVNNAALSGPLELGLTSDQVSISPRWRHTDLNTDEFGPNIPPELLWMLADVHITMTLVHFDQRVLRACMDESMGGSSDGTLAKAGRPMGGGVAIGAANNHYITLVLNCALPWRFLTAVLTETPVQWPIGTHASLVQCNWRAVPYSYPRSFGMAKYPLFDHNANFNIPQV